ncbi:hypothetical protein COU17_00890 [Candidatus Kaiserbacteria bacterium CG10_big_fil_rev_8_21_14_0_10_49_17]|uniref:Uncharacterized protein n=1 Tax=Candidatus Kaiserbacteria bacterium CG10_big_fil_rev_8_21_14_0_10_49_17 TaxID=1974609 RepID=A0A2M6WF13_9BACT|nr:MAG: hypothetical protein COU17_00890 [Candidatus Kaiserbacteria bacterium CG10_big_fil_rev_8_21_14_0_10_49_17]
MSLSNYNSVLTNFRHRERQKAESCQNQNSEDRSDRDSAAQGLEKPAEGKTDVMDFPGKGH